MHFKYRIKGIDKFQIEKGIKLTNLKVNIFSLTESLNCLELIVDCKDIDEATKVVNEIQLNLKRLEIQNDIFGLF